MNRLTLCLITCKRLNLFQQTIESFLENCLDIDLINDILLIDDNSDFDDVMAMHGILKEIGKPFIVHTKKPAEKGHQKSLNIMFDAVQSSHILLQEDDWLYTKKGHWIKDALDIMHEDESIKQFLFRTCEIMAVGQDVRIGQKGINYIKYNFIGQHARDALNRPAWPGPNLNPGIWDLNAFKKLGKFIETENNFEFNWSRRAWKAGYKVAYFPDNVCEHIGENNSSYILNQTRK